MHYLPRLMESLVRPHFLAFFLICGSNLSQPRHRVRKKVDQFCEKIRRIAGHSEDCEGMEVFNF